MRTFILALAVGMIAGPAVAGTPMYAHKAGVTEAALQADEGGCLADARHCHRGLHGHKEAPSSPAVSGKPQMRFAFCTACPAAPLPRLSTTPIAMTRSRSGSAA